jgi:hypothetical protein
MGERRGRRATSDHSRAEPVRFGSAVAKQARPATGSARGLTSCRQTPIVGTNWNGRWLAAGAVGVGAKRVAGDSLRTSALRRLLSAVLVAAAAAVGWRCPGLGPPSWKGRARRPLVLSQRALEMLADAVKVAQQTGASRASPYRSDASDAKNGDRSRDPLDPTLPYRPGRGSRRHGRWRESPPPMTSPTGCNNNPGKGMPRARR